MATNGNGFKHERTIQVFAGRLVLAFEQHGQGSTFTCVVTDLEGFVNAKGTSKHRCTYADPDRNEVCWVAKRDMKNLRLYEVQ